ncbi:MAG: DUF805 domain-containing protein [Pseudomonadota bacterium]
MEHEAPSLKWLFFSLQGRIARQSYILSFLFLLLPQIGLVLQIVRADQNGDEGGLAFWFVMLAVVALVTLWSSIALVVKRLHDLGVTGWLALILFFPTINWIFAIALMVIPSKQEVNEHGPPPFAN